MKDQLRDAINAILGRLGYRLMNARHVERLQRALDDHDKRHHRQSLAGSLAHATTLGLAPQTVLDVGVAWGTPELYAAFPDANHVLVEPLREFEPHLQKLCQRYPHMRYHIALAGAPETEQAGDAIINVWPELVGSTIYAKKEDDAEREARRVPAVTLDTLCAQHQDPGPYLLKVDVQGAELEVLRGAETVLKQCEYVVLETAFFQHQIGEPLFPEVYAFMRERGFAIYEFFEPKYRPYDGAMYQIDVAFVREAGPFRRDHIYATPEQIAEQRRQFQQHIAYRQAQLDDSGTTS